MSEQTQPPLSSLSPTRSRQPPSLPVPSADKIRSALRGAIRKQNFFKVTHVVNILHRGLVAPDVDILSLLADCYDAMTPPNLNAAAHFRSWASMLAQSSDTDTATGTFENHERPRNRCQATVLDDVRPVRADTDFIDRPNGSALSKSRQSSAEFDENTIVVDEPDIPSPRIHVPVTTTKLANEISTSAATEQFLEQANAKQCPETDANILIHVDPNVAVENVDNLSLSQMPQMVGPKNISDIAPSVKESCEERESGQVSPIAPTTRNISEEIPGQNAGIHSPPLFFIDRSCDQSILHSDDREDNDIQEKETQGQCTNLVEGTDCDESQLDRNASHHEQSPLTHDYVWLLQKMTTDLPALLLNPDFAHLGALYEITTPQASRPLYRTLSSPSQIAQPVNNGDSLQYTVECEVPLSLTVQVEDIISNAFIRCTASDQSRQMAMQKSARTAIETLESRVDQIRVAALEKFQAGLSLKFKEWKSGNLAVRCHDAFKTAQEIILSENHGNLYGAKVRPFGSFAAGLILPGSDIDIEVALPKPDEKMAAKRTYACHPIRVLKYLAHELIRVRMDRVLVIETARVPILRYIDKDQRVPVDISVVNPGASLSNSYTDGKKKTSSVLVSRVIRQHLSQDTRIWEVAIFIKYWSQSRNIYRIQDGFINALGWAIMAIWYLQRLSPAIGCSLRIQNATSSHEARDIVITRVPRRTTRGSGCNKLTTGEIIGRFFEYFANFDFANAAISLAYHEVVPRAEVDRMPARPIFIEHPLEPGVNITSGVQASALNIIRTELRRAHHTVVSTGDISHVCAKPSRE